MGTIHILRILCGTQWRCPAVLQDEQGLVLVDCPDPGTFPALAGAFAERGLRLRDVRAVLISHHDYDHTGTLSQVLECSPGARVYAAAEEIPYITGWRLPLRRTSPTVLPARVDAAVKDGDCFSWCGGARVVATPGHMAGHLSLYLSGEKTLLAGDALSAAEGELYPPSPAYTLDMEEALGSVRKLLELDINRVVCYHGGVVEGRIRERILHVLRDMGGR